jgi:hypothetical protein
VVGLQLRVRFVPAALLAVLRTALALQRVSELESGQVMQAADLSSLCYLSHY